MSLWLRQNVSWSNSWPSWQERLILLLFLAIAVGLSFLSVAVVRTQGATFGVIGVLAALWAGYIVALIVCSWLGWLKLFGPVLFYDMIRTARRNRYFIMRMVYAVLLLVILCVMFFTTSEIGSRNQRFDRRDTAILAETFFSAFMIVQLVMVVLLTPAYVAGAIAEEKDRKTLEFMLATDLNNREIVLSKLLSRLANIMLLLLTGLPILSILQFLGGVDTQLMLAGFAMTGLTMLGIASLSILLSTLFQKPRDAIGLTYLTIIAYLALATFAKTLAMGGVTWPFWLSDLPPLADVSEVLNAGNPIAAIIDVIIAMNRASLSADIPRLLENYFYFHVAASLLCVVWSIVRLRAIALAHTAGGTTRKLNTWEPQRPPIGDLPMIWKELHIEGRMKFNWLARGVVTILVLLTVGSGVFIIGMFIWESLFGHRASWREFFEVMNVWFRIAGTGVLSLMILNVGVRASTCVAHERERDTFDALITTPMSAEAILFAKFLGCLTSMRLGWLWVGSMITIALLTGGIHLLAVPIIIVAWFIYATFFTMVGIWFSMACQSSLRATVYTVMMTLLLGGGHWVVMGFLCYMPAAILARGGPGDLFEFFMKFQLGMTPPFVLGLFSYSWEDLAHHFHGGDDFLRHVMLFSILGLVLWSAGCAVMWYGLLVPKFKQITRREELIYE